MTTQQTAFNYGSMFCGAGIGTSRMSEINGKLTFAIDYDPKQTAIIKRNNPNAQVITEDVLNFTGGMPKLDVLQASPPCCTYSGQRKKIVTDEERDLDFKMALSVADYAKASSANVVIVENVPSFFHRSPFQRLYYTMWARGYENYVHISLSGGDLGLPICRKRGFSIFSKTRIIDTKNVVDILVRHNWLEMIGDARTLNERKYSPKQLDALKDAQSFPVILNHVSYFDRQITELNETAPPILAHAADDGKDGKGRSKIWSIVEQDLTRYNVEVRGFARLMGVPDDYWLPEDHKSGLRAVGNGVIAQALPYLIDRYGLVNSKL